MYILSKYVSTTGSVPQFLRPAAIAENDMMNVSGLYKIQWAGFSGAPEDLYFAVDMPIEIAGTKHGVGLSFLSDKIGLFSNQSVLLQYSYKLKLFNGVLGMD